MSAGITLGALFLVLLSVLLANRLAIGRDREKAILDARARFRGTFAEASALLRSASTDPFQVLRSARDAHEAAIAEFRSFVPRNQLARYDEASERFRKLREAINPGIIAYYERQATGTPYAPSTRDIVNAIDELLSHADN